MRTYTCFKKIQAWDYIGSSLWHYDNAEVDEYEYL